MIRNCFYQVTKTRKAREKKESCVLLSSAVKEGVSS